MAAKYQSRASARIVEVIEVVFTRGTGVEDDPVREVKQYRHKDGALIVEIDVCAQPDHPADP